MFGVRKIGYSETYVNIHVMSFEDAAIYSSSTDIPPTIVISIDDVGFPVTPIDIDNPNILGVLKLFFTDTDIADAYAMTDEDADNIISFVKHYLPLRPEILVHCAAGVSRSAGVAAALGRWLNGDERFVFDSPYRNPNILCYKKVLDAADVHYDETIEHDKFEDHRQMRKSWLKNGYDDALISMGLNDDGYDSALDQKTIDAMEKSWKDIFERNETSPDTTFIRELISIGLKHIDELETDLNDSWT